MQHFFNVSTSEKYMYKSNYAILNGELPHEVSFKAQFAESVSAYPGLNRHF